MFLSFAVFDNTDGDTDLAAGAVVGTIVRQWVSRTLPTRVVVQVLVRVCANALAANDNPCANGQQLKCLTVTDEFTEEGWQSTWMAVSARRA